MFTLKKHPCKITHLNLRTQKAGDEDVNAIDITLAFDLPNSCLDTLSAGLRPALYERADDPDLIDDPDHLTRVRFPKLGTHKWAGDLMGAGVHFHLGNGRGKGDLLFIDSNLRKLEITPKEGGTCACRVQAQVLPTPDETAKLAALNQHEIPVTTDLSQAEPYRRKSGQPEPETETENE